ncbi:MAG: alpha/beta hydrolase [candidate division Zixibacteria bacterium]|nr:alpha/beta hydrolase [candidate division Zixibacteria bacterium]
MYTRNKSVIGIILLVVILVVALSACVQKVEKPAVIESAVVVDSVASEDGVMIYYDVQGEGDRTLVFVHGWSCDRSYWDGQVSNLAPDFRVVTIDLGGHGQSGLGRDAWTMSAFGADVAAVVTKLDLHDIILIGHSMGGPVCIEAVRRLPGKVTAIVGVDNFQSFASNLTPEQVDGFVANFMPDFETTTVQFVNAMFPEGTDTALVGRISRDMASAPREVGISAIAYTVSYDYKSALADMRRPIRTISSDKHPTNVELNKQIAASFEVRLIPGSSHFPQLENPDNFNRLLRETISEFWPGTEVPPTETN